MAISDSDRPKQASRIKIRLIITVMAVLCPVVCYISRQNLSMAINAMVKQTNITQQHMNTTHPQTSNQTQAQQVDPSARDDFCPVPVDSAGHAQAAATTYGPQYEWSSSDRSIVLGAFFITYVIFQIPAGRMAEVIGPSYIFQTATIGSALISAFFPLAASTSPLVFALLRGLMGVCQCAIYPACYVLVSKWLPPSERAQAIPMFMAGAFIGSIIASSGTGFLSEQESFGWEYSFYFASFICLLWAVFWFFLGADEPRKHKLISLEEIHFIESQLELKLTQANGEPAEPKKPSWRKILSSPAIWAMNIAFIASDWAFTITLILLPTYLNDILHITPLKNGLINSIIYGLFIITAPIYGLMSAFLIDNKVYGWSSLTYRKIFQSLVLFSQGICFILIVFFGCDTYLILVTLFTQIVFYSFNNVGEVLVPAEISPEFSGTIYAIANTIASSTGFIVPQVQSFLVPNTKIRSDWANFFYLSAGVTFAGGIVFALFGKNNYHDFSKSEEPEDRIEVFHMSTGRHSTNTFERCSPSYGSGKQDKRRCPEKEGDKERQIVI